MDPTLQNGQDPEAIRRAQLLAAIMGKAPAPGAPGASQPATPGFAPNPADANAPSGPVAQPMTSPKPPVAKPMATPTTAVEPGNQPPPFASEEEWNKANPAAPHTPYVEPDLKHRLLMGLFAGLQQFGRDPGAGERMLGSYLGDIEKKEEAEKHYPDTSAAAQHQRYMTAAQGAAQPLHIQQLQAQIADSQAQAKERAAKAAAEANPPAKMKPVIIADPAGKDPHGMPALQNQTTGEIMGEDGKTIPGAKLWEKPAPVQKLNDFESFYPKYLKEHGVEDNATNEAKARAIWNQAGKETPDQKHSASELAQVERETRAAIRKAQETYRGAQSTATLQREFISEAKGGNKAAVKIVPLEGALEITTSQGVHRINRTEVDQYGSAGNLFDRIAGRIGKGLTGKDIPDDVLNDMDKMTQQVEKNAWDRYNAEYDDESGIAKGYGLNLETKLPRIKRGASGAAGGSAAGAAAADPNNPLGI